MVGRSGQLVFRSLLTRHSLAAGRRVNGYSLSCNLPRQVIDLIPFRVVGIDGERPTVSRASRRNHKCFQDIDDSV